MYTYQVWGIDTLAHLIATFMVSLSLVLTWPGHMHTLYQWMRAPLICQCG